ncbi:MAG: glycosyltransferase [Jannaschia sp.]
MVLTTLGSLGDLYPVLSLARALENRGIEARLALSPDDCEVARKWGLLATPVTPSEAEVSAALGMTRDEIAASILRDPSPLLSRMAIPMLPDLVPRLLDLCDGAACVTGTTFALGAPIAAERAGLPFVPLVLQPMLTFAPEDPPQARGFGLAVQRPGTRFGLAWNGMMLAVMRMVLRGRHGRELTKIRASLGLPAQPGTPLIDFGGEVPMRLALWSEHFSPVPSSAHAFRTVGFPPAPEGALPDQVRTWLRAGPPPLVVTLGSIAQGLGGARFWSEAVTMARNMGLRVVLLHGTAAVPDGPDVLALPYAAHAPLFPEAAAIVHHGGIGTTAEALRSGRPQLVVPVGGDQPDNAARLERLGVAVTLPIKQFRGHKATRSLTGLLDRFDYARAADLGETLWQEDGAALAARLLEEVVVARNASRPR